MKYTILVIKSNIVIRLFPKVYWMLKKLSQTKCLQNLPGEKCGCEWKIGI